MYRTNVLANVLFCSGLLLSTPLHAVTLGFSPSTQAVGVGGVAHVDIVASGLEAPGAGGLLAAYDLTVAFNEFLISPTGVTVHESPFGALPLTGSDLSVGGEVSFNLASLEDDATLSTLQGDAIVLATIDFNLLAEGSTPLTFSHVDLTGANAEALTASILNGDVTAVPLPSVLFLFGLSIFGLVNAGWRNGRALRRHAGY